ncbi:MAG TPA: GntR family transcriptional regulator [Longimicrobium sp.]|jgi:GntR family transcriptional regulator
MLPFEVVLRAGESPYRQVVYAATRAVVAGEMAPGSSFPSVRELSQALKINPNTAHKVVAQLVRDGILEVLPGIGTVVAETRHSSPEERRLLLSEAVEHLVVEAKRLGLDEEDVLDAVSARWAELFGEDGPHENARARNEPGGSQRWRS